MKPFDKAFFAQWQTQLLWLLNSRLTKNWFRWILRIRQCDCPINEQVVAIAPNAFWFGLKDNQVTADFRTHDKFAKRLYFAFKPFWWLIHAWDWLVADRFVSKLSFGFSSLTAYPVAGTNSPIDGGVYRESVDENFATIRAGAGTSTNDSAAKPSSGGGYGLRIVASTTSNQYNWLARLIFCFDTSAIGSTPVVSRAVFSLSTDAGVTNQLGNPDFHFCSSNPASTGALASADFSSLGSTSFGSIATAAWVSNNTYMDTVLNGSGIANVSKTGISKFGARLGWDILNSTTGLTWISSQQVIMDPTFADASGTSNDPKLVVTYQAPGLYPASLLFFR